MNRHLDAPSAGARGLLRASQRRIACPRSLIDDAIVGMRRLSFIYQGYTRVVEPHLFGIDCTGHFALSCYQVRGGSHSGLSSGWKHCRLDGIEVPHLLDERFSGPRPDYNAWDTHFVRVFCRI